MNGNRDTNTDTDTNNNENKDKSEKVGYDLKIGKKLIWFAFGTSEERIRQVLDEEVGVSGECAEKMIHSMEWGQFKDDQQIIAAMRSKGILVHERQQTEKDTQGG